MIDSTHPYITSLGLGNTRLPNVPDSQTAGLRLNPGEAFRGDQGASNLLGKINRAQWTDWKARFAPYIDVLADLASDGAAPRESARMASTAMGQAYDTSQQGLEQRRQGLGLNLTPQQREAEERRSDLRRTGAMVSAGNQARIAAQDRQQAILAGGMGLTNIPDRVLNP